MKAICCVFLMLAASAWAADPADSEAIRRAIATFNDPGERATVLARDADLSPLLRFAGQEVSQVYFEAKSIRFVTPDVAFVDAAASQFGSLIMKRAMPAVFVLKREAGAWRISVMRIVGQVGNLRRVANPPVAPVNNRRAACQAAPQWNRHYPWNGGTSTQACLALLFISASRIVNWRSPSTNCGYSGAAVGSAIDW